ncbi:MAG: xanthine dehydrogenase family protein subunit M [Nitrososphaerales archaeon]|jgi:carbon-monoxide dehydrogenase medium subunit
MVPRKFEYIAPTSVGEATAFLRVHGSDAKVLAGGMSLIPVMKLRLASPAYIVDINRIPGMDYIRRSDDGGGIAIGSLTRHHDIETSKLIREHARALSECAAGIGDPQIRNMGTLGGSLAHCDPSGDCGSAVLALRGSVVVRGPTRGRTVAIDDFLVDTFTSALEPDELLTEITIPIRPGMRTGSSYVKLERKTGDFATVAVGAAVGLDESGVCDYAGIGLTAVGSKNLRAVKAEEALLGKTLTPSVIEEAAQAASEDAHPTADPLRGSADYKREMTKVYTRRGLQLAVSRAEGGAR